MKGRDGSESWGGGVELQGKGVPSNYMVKFKSEKVWGGVSGRVRLGLYFLGVKGIGTLYQNGLKEVWVVTVGLGQEMVCMLSNFFYSSAFQNM